MKSRIFSRLCVIAGLTAVAAVAAQAPAVLAAGRHSHHRQAVSASASLATASVYGTTVSVIGHVRLRHGTSADRRRARVLIALADGSGGVERRIGTLGTDLRFRVAWSTKLAGRLVLRVRLTIAGKRYGRLLKRTLNVTQPGPAGGTPLVGTFKIDPGSAPSGQAPTGSYFEMLQSNGSPLGNLSSPAPNKDFTPLSPGTDGGLRTDAYQPAPSPAFAGGTLGGALANRIIQPVPFYLINFSVETSPTDAQVGAHDAIPSIDVENGQLSGQITAWDAQWNGQSFNQGTPKPNGSLPAPTTPLSGSYDASTHAFTLDWKSLIVGGPFNGFTGLWHLAGTFVPAATASGGLPLPLPLL